MSKKKILILAAVLLIAIIGQGLLAHRLRQGGSSSIHTGSPQATRLARQLWAQ